MKQTAVEWLESKLFEFETIQYSLPTGLYEYLEQAKEMEKQQIENAFDDGWNRANETKQQAYTTLEDMGSNYYNKTYNK